MRYLNIKTNKGIVDFYDFSVLRLRYDNGWINPRLFDGNDNQINPI